MGSPLVVLMFVAVCGLPIALAVITWIATNCDDVDYEWRDYYGLPRKKEKPQEKTFAYKLGKKIGEEFK